jgi:hypothetical protein
MKILIVDSKNRRERIDVNGSGYVKEIFETLKNKMGINIDIVLHFNGEILEENQKISELDLEEESVIVYMGTFRGGKIFI